MTDPRLSSLLEKIDNYRDESIELQKLITKIPALAPENGGDGEKEKYDLIKGWIQAEIQPEQLLEFPAADERVSAGVRPNMVATKRGQQSNRTIWIMSHLDVVPAGDLSKWTGDPWVVRVAKDRKGRTKLIGRGTEDNQQGLVSSLFAVKALREREVVPNYDVGLIIVADEETGNHFGVKHLLKNHRRLFRKKDLLIIPDAGNEDGTMIEIAEKSILWVRFKVSGRQAHASEPEKGTNAHKAAAFLVTRLETLHARFRKSNRTFDPPISTFEPTKRESNVPNVNTIPGEDVFYLDCRILPDYKLQEVLRHIRRHVKEIEQKFRVKISLSFPQKEQAAPPTSPDAEVVTALKQALWSVHRIRPRPMGIGGGTVAAYFRKARIPAAVWSTMDDMAHSPDEYCIVENMLNDAKVFCHVFLQNLKRPS